ncbi:6430550D23Rik [Phodopus roborovskii]|uniref:6430550D23Rik protein n=1 Tax=Phodopus roborovskii TaxID=109678 RepID=A0AAU9YQ42_PHORO|nr:6430550D23Rik [Phodopus roborovskii]
MEYCWVFGGLILLLMAPYLDRTHESALQQEWTYMVPQHCNWLCFKFGESGCFSRTPNCSTCHHTAGEWSWFEACYEKSMGYLRRTEALWWLGMNSVSKLGKTWKKLSEMIPRPLLHHFDFPCVPCTMLGNSGLSSTNQFDMDFRMSEDTTHSSEAVLRSQTTGPSICPRNASHQGSWEQWSLELAELVTRFWETV